MLEQGARNTKGTGERHYISDEHRQAVASLAIADRTVVPRADHRLEAPGHEH